MSGYNYQYGQNGFDASGGYSEAAAGGKWNLDLSFVKMPFPTGDGRNTVRSSAYNFGEMSAYNL